MNKADRREVRLQRRRKEYTHLPPKAERAAAEPKRRHKAIFVPILGKTMFDAGMGSKAVRLGGISSHAPSTHSKRRKNPVGMKRKRAARERRRAHDVSTASLRVDQRSCEKGAHELRTVAQADGKKYRFCIRYQCGFKTAAVA